MVIWLIFFPGFCEKGLSGRSCVLCGVVREWICRPVSGYAMLAPTRTLMMLRVSRHHGTLRHSSSSIVGPPHIDAPPPFPLIVCIFFFFHPHSSGRPCVLILIPVAIISLSRCVVLLLLSSTNFVYYDLTALHSFIPFVPSLFYAHFIYSPHSLAFIFVLYQSSRAGTTYCYSTRPAPRLPFPSFLLISIVPPLLSNLSYIVPRHI